jgi:uncharacterized RDD family membrane protein YckC
VNRTATAASPKGPSLLRRTVCALYETLLLTAVLFFAALPVVVLTNQIRGNWVRPAFQVYLVLVAAVYFVFFWAHGGQTLAMKTWGIRLAGGGNGPPGVRQAFVRYLFALIGIMAGGLGFLWALWDREGLFLHDRLAGTRLILAPCLKKADRRSQFDGAKPMQKNDRETQKDQGGQRRGR